MFVARQRLLLLLIAGLCLDTYGAPAEEHKEGTNPELTDGYFQGDMDVEFQRSGLIDPKSRWPNATVYYKIDEVFNDRQIDHIKLAMNRIAYVSCIQFVPATPKPLNYVLFTSSKYGCYSTSTGFKGGEHIISLFPNFVERGCFRLSEIEHQLLHTLGFIDQHVSPDRDKYIKINTNNINPAYVKNFAKLGANAVDNYGAAYDYGSIMHYSAKLYSKNGKPVIVALQPEGQFEMGQRYAMTKSDIKRLNKMYKCPVKIHH